MKSSQVSVDPSQRQSLQETGEHEEPTSDPRNVGRDFNKKKRLSTTPVLIQAGAQRNQCTHFMILRARRENGGIRGAIKVFLVYLTKGDSAKGKETLTKQ